MPFLDRLKARFRTGSTFEVVSTEFSLAEASSADRLSLFVVVTRPHSGGRPLLDGRPFLQTIGFASNWSARLRDQPRRFATIDSHTIDRFVTFEESSRARALATVHIREVHAWDMLYRSDIGATGIQVRIELHPEAVGPIARFLETHRDRDDPDGFRSGCVLRFPVRRVIRFPEPRGEENPYDGSSKEAEKLNEIATVRAESLEMAVMAYPSSPAIEWETQPLGPLLASSTILRLSST